MSSQLEAPYPLPSLIRNRTAVYDAASGAPGSAKILTSRNDAPYHYVVHSDHFEYDVYALHMGQHDKLSFFAEKTPGPVLVHLYDCRDGSPEFGRKLVIEVPTDGSLCLSVPPGYAHWFEHLEYVTTRNDYSIYGPASADVPWNALHDNMTFPVADMAKQCPKLVANTVPLPMDAQFFIGAAVSKTWAGGVTESGVVLSLNIDGSEETVFIDKKMDQPFLRYASNIDLATARSFVGAHQAIRDESYSIAANTRSGLADTMVLDLPAEWPRFFSIYPRLGITLTTLLYDGPTAEVELIDRCRESPSFGQRAVVELPQDARLSLHLDPGVAMRFRGSGRLYYRVEYEMFAEPGSSPLKLAIPADQELPSFERPQSPVDPKVLRLAAYE
jgi:hypothetical protein